jgi:hypothetical protein
MGRCVNIGGQPLQIDIQLPGGIKIASMAHATQQIPNIMDPFQSLLQGVQPALGAMKPVFDIIGFVMQLMQCWLAVVRIFAALAVPVIGPTAPSNPLIALFPPPPMLGDDGEPLDPYIPDLPKLFTDFLNCIAGLLGKALKLAGLVPQISIGITVKDSIIAAMGFADAAMAQLNSLADLFTGLPAADTGNVSFDLTLQCAADNSTVQLTHKLGPVANLVPLFAVIGLLVKIAKQPLPSVILDMSKLMANPAPNGFGVIPFPDLSGVGGPSGDEQREQFLGLIEEMTISGLPIDIPDFGDLSSLGQTLNDLKAQVEPILPVIQMVQGIFNKLTEA